jgi:hypothetical protein
MCLAADFFNDRSCVYLPATVAPLLFGTVFLFIAANLASAQSHGRGLSSFATSNVQLWIYEDANQHIQELTFTPSTSQWTQIDITVSSGAPIAGQNATLASMVNASSNYMFAFQSANQHIYVITYTRSSSLWSYVDITAASNAPILGPSSSVSNFIGATGNDGWSFVAPNQHVYEIVFTVPTQQWGYTDLTSTANAPLAISGSGLASFIGTTGNQAWIFEGASSQHLFEIVYNITSGTFGYTDLTTSANAPLPIPGSQITAFLEPSSGSQNWTYQGTGNHIVEIHLSGSSHLWSVIDLTASALAAAPPTGSALASFATPSGADWTYQDFSGAMWQIAEATSGAFTYAEIQPVTDESIQISGQILLNGAGLSGVTISLTGTVGTGTQVQLTAVTNSTGIYVFNVPAGGTYMLEPVLSGYSFSPASQTLSNVNAAVTQAQASTASSGSLPTPPSISKLSLYDGPPLMGFIISGGNFGGSQGSSTVVFNGYSLIVITWTAAAVTVQLPSAITPTAPNTGTLRITVGGQSATTSFTVSLPFGCSS